MKIVGLIAEYNPFHNGHKYHIEEAKKISGADHAIVVMSGNYVQRGAPAIMPKEIRVKAALNAGASMVIELPTCYATSSAEFFALGALETLNKLNCVDSICFGSECGNIELLQLIADILHEEPEEYRKHLQSNLKQGDSFPKARKNAFLKYVTNSIETPDFTSDELARVFDEPNNILGIEYLKAMRKTDTDMKAFTIKREGSGYHDLSIDNIYCSASALRNESEQILTHNRYYPDFVFNDLKHNIGKTFPIKSNDFSLLLKSILLYETASSLIEYNDVSNELANRIIRYRNDFQSFDQFVELLKTKELTYTRISRALLHILLRIKKNDMEKFNSSGIVFYARILGFKSNATELFSILKTHSMLPLLTKPSNQDSLDELGKQMLDIDVLTSNLYRSVITERYSVPFQNELTWQIIKS